MINALLAVKLQTGAFPVIVYALSVLAVLWLALKRPVRAWLPIQLLGAAIGVGGGYLLAWLVSDIWNTFEVSLSWVTRLWFAAACAGIGFALAGLWKSRAPRTVGAALAVLLFALAGGVGVNIDTAEFPTLGSVFGVGPSSQLSLPALITTPAGAAEPSLSSSWRAPADLRRAGIVGSVTIPGTVSRFAARRAIVYLPPAALVKNPPRLPVLVMLSGQPGSPANIFTSGAMATLMDASAGRHHGLAPIIVVPDQLGASLQNPMCVDSPLGNSQSYLTVDVPHWISTHLNVLADRTDWAIGGFSQGGTCSIQIGAKFPQLFGSIIDISGQLAPHRGTVAATIASAFGGSAAAYAAAAPSALLAAGAPYRDTFAYFCVGQNDTRYAPVARALASAARAAGMRVRYEESPATAHDWHTVQFGIRQSLPGLYDRWGLG